MRLILKVFLLLALIIFSACASDVVDTTGNVVGCVKDARTNSPIQGASVTLSELGKSSTTGADGMYAFRDVESKSYTVQVTKANYISDSKKVFVEIGKNNELDFALTPSVAELAVSKLTLDFGTVTTTLTLDIKNNGSSVLTWQISEDIAWLSCSPTSGSTQPGETSSVIVNVNREGLERGNYSQTIAIASNGGSQDVRVNMAVQGISVSFAPEILDFGSITTSMQLTMTNNGTGSISYSIAPSNEWIKLSKATGVFTSKDYITVSVDRSTFSPGDYQGSVTVMIDDESAVIPVRMNIPTKAKPTVSLYSVDDISYNSATFRGGLAAVGSAKVTRHGFCWNTTGEPTIENGETCNLGDCSEAKDFAYSATSLTASTTYYVRAYAENMEGISYSNIVKFQTTGTPEKPTVETGNVSDIAAVQAVVAGNILSLGNVDEIIQYGHVWSENPNPTTSSSKTAHGKTQKTGAFISTLTDLKPNTKYYVRAYATNSIGTAYGKEITFTTNKVTEDGDFDKNGYGQDGNWDNGGSASVDKNGYGQDGNWDSSDAASVGKNGYGVDKNWN